MPTHVARYRLVFVAENGRTPIFDYARSMKGRWRITGENEAVSIVRLLEEIAASGPQGAIETVGGMDLYMAAEGRHRVAHAPDPTDPAVVFGLAAFDQGDLASGRDQAWRLLRKVLGLIP